MNEFFSNYGPWLLFIAVMFFMMRRGGCCGGHGHGHSGHKGRGGDNMSHCCGGGNVKTVTLNVEGMTCGHCKASVEKALSAIEGVNSVDVDLNGKKVTVSFQADKVNEADLKKAITDQGYQVL
ncbi:copper ion binding protein [Thermincola ferriacetica]|uniref:Copper chaperone CopZ n=2 Tax=Thermincola TaxID=278993 RepID=D5X9H8_THEPJ|nr:copper ion binding protein [Thermincola potens JR]KNZ70568.1 copper ion binding protein [Thermincola ferriacetica]